MNAKENLIKAFKKIELKIEDIKVINLSTLDGFPLCTHYFNSSSNKLEDDKLSAAVSSMAALSQAAAKQMIGSKFSSTTIETENGSMLLVKTKYNKASCILCFITGNNHQIGQVRYFAFKLSDYLKNSL